MVFADLRREERIGLGIALGLHVALGAALLVQPTKRATVPPVEKMTVSLSPEVGLQSTAPEPVAESAAAVAPTLAPDPAPPASPAPPEPAPRAIPEPLPSPARPVVRAPARPKPAPSTRPMPRVTPAPVAKPKPAPAEPRRRPDAPASNTRSAPATAPAVSRPKPAGGSRIGSDFLPGAGDSTETRETRTPASQIGASAKASLAQAIAREIKPRWQSPQGPDVELLVTILAFNLNDDGSLAGSPRVVRQEGINDLNRKQAELHAEAAVKAVRLAAPFDLPAEYYEAWKRVSSFRFDRKL